MRAAVYRGDRRIDVDELPVPEPGDTDVVVEVSHCGICGSDLHVFVDGWGAPGSTGGHEWSGVVTTVGGDVEGWKPGDRVVGGPDGGCGECEACTQGRGNLCAGRGRAGVDPHQGAFARYVKASQRALYRIPDELDLRTAALTEPLAVALHQIDRSHAAPGDSVLVTGAGPIGLLTVAALAALGVDDVTVSEPAPRRRERAAAVGAKHAVSPDELPPAPQLPMDVIDAPFDAAIDCSGRAEAMEHALALLRRGGRLVLSGTGMKRPRIDSNRVILNELVVTGAVEYVPDDYHRALELLARGALPTDELIEPDDVPLAGMQDAVARLAAGELAGKVLVVPQ
jgi:(R,R)-butanediol dehydrogenase/meso-butanediol dehydrogenase/diacetyl reductase